MKDQEPLIAGTIKDNQQKKKAIKFIWISILIFIVLAGSAVTIYFLVFYKNKYKYPFLDPTLPIAQRVDDLVGRLTLEEKVQQMVHSAANIDRLAIPKQNWWNEGLHGVARAGIATVFPQAIGLAATWNEDLIMKTADIISTEFRAKFNNYTNETGKGSIYHGLTVWSPNINIFRDPRWGRGQETQGEDPHLTSRIGVAFVKGLQGNHSTYYKAIATVKHFAVHSGPEPTRAGFDAIADQPDLAQTYLPAFRATIMEGKAFSIMGAYNRLNGVPCCANDFLQDSQLRNSWNFTGYAVSDCGAIGNIFQHHHYVKTKENASAIAVIKGTDLECGDFYLNLPTGVQQKLITETTIDKSVKRLMQARMRLGLFDPIEMVDYNKINITENDKPAHREMAKQVARESIVLLKNKDNVLPLAKNIASIAIIGPNANDSDVMFGNYRGDPSAFTTPLKGIQQKVTGSKVSYAIGCSQVDQVYTLKNVSSDYLLSKNGTKGLDGYQWNNPMFEGDPYLERIDSIIKGSFNQMISIRWNGSFVPGKTGDYILAFNVVDGIKVYFEGEIIIESWEKKPFRRIVSKILSLKAEQQYKITIEYCHIEMNNGLGIIFFQLSDDALTEQNKSIQIANNSDYIVFFGGISPNLEGEEMDVEVPGFQGGDRTSIDLPQIQTGLLKKLKDTGKPIILVLMSGCAFSINWEADNIPAILQSWYPGEEGGSAIADILFGDQNPSGKLPISFQPDINKLPDFNNQSMENRTYRYYNETLLFEFGFGLSYTSFKYESLKVPPQIKTNESLNISVDVINSGDKAGEEIAEIYLKFLDYGHFAKKLPLFSLQGFQKFLLSKGERKGVVFCLNSRQLSIINDQNKRLVAAGNIEVYVGGRMPSKESISKALVLVQSVTISGPDYIIEDEIH